MRHPNLARHCSSSSLSCSARATASSSTRRPPPHPRRGELTSEAPDFYLSRAPTPHESLHPVPPISLSILERPTLTPLPPLSFHSGNARHCRGQPPPGTPRPHRPPCELPRSLLVLTDPLVLSNFSRSPVTDVRRRRRLRPRRGTSLSGLPQLQLTSHQASSHCQDAFRPLLRHPRAPEYGPRHFFPTAGRRSLLHCHDKPSSSDPVQLKACKHPVVPLPPLRPHRWRPSSPEMAAQPLPPFTSSQGPRVRRSKSPGGCLQTIGLRETILIGTPV
jgi:hypothetical protein